MKTSLACLGILILALIFGQSQGARIDRLENQIRSSKIAKTAMGSHRTERENHSSYRSKYARRTQGATASEVFVRLEQLAAPYGGSDMGVGAAMQHRETMQAILQLDLKGMGELMSLVYQSKELAKRWPMQPVAAVLCLIAMTDSSPEAAFTHMTESKEWNRLFSPDHIHDGSLVSYVLARMAEDDPQRALDSMRKLENTPKALNENSVGKLLGQVVHRDPALVLDAITDLPDADREHNYQMIGYGLESDDERTALFLAVRDRLESRPAEMKLVLFSLCSRFGDADRSVPEVKEWLEGLGMTGSEKLIIAEGVGQYAGNFNTNPVTHARWLAKFLPPSEERDGLIFSTLEPLIRHDPPGMSALMKELGVGP